ncbi:MAG: ATP-dependent helicase [Thermodesulfobacteriota bacterium]|nr:ATP-dependent helicase [Thermodesulfobacteriota bacterium]
MVEQSHLYNHKQRFNIKYEEELNPAQLEAVTSLDGPMLVIAGAGSGKTRTLTYRVARLVERGISPASILLLTFTRKASAEMLSRAAQLLDNRCERVSGGTFHSFSNSMLRKYASILGFDNKYTILDRVDAESLIGMLRKELNPGPKHRSFPRKRTLANIFSRSVNKVISLEDVIYNDYPHFLPYLDDIVNLAIEYKNRKVMHGFFDYDDLLVSFDLLLKNHTDIRDSISSLYQYIMVDEYQDTNQIQASILYSLTSKNKNVMVVGDDSQSIYAFRGANFKNIIDFPQLFPETKIISLEENYRSVQPILDLTNVIIDRAAEKFSKKLFTRKTGGVTPLLACTQSENDQSMFVVDKIQELNMSGVPLSRMAVLFRAGFHSFDLEIELAREKIPFIKVGGFKFTESAHIKDVLAHLKVIANPHDRISWYRILLLIEKIGPKTAQNIYQAIHNERSGYTGIFTIKLKSGLNQRLSRLRQLFSNINSNPLSVAEMGEIILHYYLPVLKDRYDNHPKRARDLEQLLAIMQRYNSLEQFLTDMALEPPNTSMDNTFTETSTDNNRLVLSTIHSAKGLEWHTVFIIWTLDGRFPSIHSLNNEEDLEEELRLMYVAATRAQNNLFFTYPGHTYDRGSGMIFSRPSRFIDMIPDDILEKYYVD